MCFVSKGVIQKVFQDLAVSEGEQQQSPSQTVTDNALIYRY